MPEPLKNLFNPHQISEMGLHLQRGATSIGLHFDAAEFSSIAKTGLDALELKQRAEHIQRALTESLPQDFATACELITSALHPDDEAELGNMEMDARGIRGWSVMPLAQYVSDQCLSQASPDIEHGLAQLRNLTSRFTAEWAIRDFIIADPDTSLRVLSNWADDANFHVRRLVSEGSRPRLPWGKQLKQFIHAPEPVLPLLTRLRDDPHDYVRRSVANHLNDISKDHPHLIAEIAANWMVDANPFRISLIKHACRSLIKHGFPPALAALGYGKAELKKISLTTSPTSINLGERVVITAAFTSGQNQPQNLIVDYVVHHRRANGTASPKTFKWKNLTLSPRESVTLEKNHAVKKITTRAYYPGEHVIELQINGAAVAKTTFSLST